MKLTELEPRWFRSEDGATHGFTMLCPHCKATRLGVSTTTDGARLMHDHQDLDLDTPDLHVAPSLGCSWHMTGTSFEDMSVTPSIDASASGHWHGFITNGDAT